MNKKQVPYSKLRGVDLLLGNSTDNDSSAELDINLIVKPPSQPRRYFDRTALEQLKSSIEQHGILEPLLVRPLANGKYELVAGERRFRAALELKLTTVPVSIKTLTDLEAKQIALIENLQRVDLNPVEETEGILELLSIQLKQDVEQVISLLYRMHNEAKGKVTHNVMGNEEKQKIEQIFQGLSLMTWESFVQNRLPLLKLPSDILEAIRTGQLAYTKAIALSKIKEEIRENLLKEVIENNLSVREIKERIKQLQEKPIESPSTTVKDLMKNIEKKKLWETEPKKWKKVETLLDKITLLLEE
jgi:ParB family chromosome partitioning protein